MMSKPKPPNPTCQVLIQLSSELSRRCNQPGTTRWLLRNTTDGTLAEIWVCDTHKEDPIV